MSIKVHLELDGDSDGQVLQVPLDSVVRRTSGETRVWLVVPGQPATVESRPLVLGRRSGQMVEVTRGEIRAGDRVVVRGNESLRAGQAVILHEEQAAR
jgi:multidrug efflux pump subunit AcrA (membrane-fusion protein)